MNPCSRAIVLAASAAILVSVPTWAPAGTSAAAIRVHVHVEQGAGATDVRLDPEGACAGGMTTACLARARTAKVAASGGVAWFGDLEPGTYGVRVSLEGHGSVEGPVRVGAGETLVLAAELRPLPAGLGNGPRA